MEITQVIEYLKSYDGRQLKLMEVCGTHTAAIFKNGIRDLISPKIKLISGPGCPVCVTPTAFIDKCVSYAKAPNCELLTFGDMMKVPGTAGSLSENKAGDAHISIMYSPLEAIEKAEANPDITYVVAAVGFETTAPTYALLVKEAARRGLENIRLVTALKTAIPALHWICENQNDIDGFICPGHVSVITGIHVYDDLAEEFRKPFVVSGFEAEHILAAIYRIVRQIEAGEGRVENMYPNAVRENGNPNALQVIEDVYEPGLAVWRGLGPIADSGLYLREEYARFDGGSRGLDEDMELPEGCRCGDVITGRINPDQCPMFAAGTCTPMDPFGPCMVSSEGSCGIWYRNRH
jgi:hydrogenase expression/formation protein HypD